MEILVFGLENENAVLSSLRKRFPSVGFKKCTLSDDLEQEGRRLVVIDTLRGLDRVTLVDDPNLVSPGRAMDGSGALMTLRILLKLGSLESVRMIAVPDDYPREDVVEEMARIIADLSSGTD
jgi:hypothetical protein